jgi:hypothetical protein
VIQEVSNFSNAVEEELTLSQHIIIIIIISCHRFSFFPGTSALEPVVNPTTQASSLSLHYYYYHHHHFL